MGKLHVIAKYWTLKLLCFKSDFRPVNVGRKDKSHISTTR